MNREKKETRREGKREESSINKIIFKSEVYLDQRKWTGLHQDRAKSNYNLHFLLTMKIKRTGKRLTKMTFKCGELIVHNMQP